MNNTKHANEKIELTLPVNAAYVSAARLTASSIANRMSFSIDEIEDIKSAVSEACVFIINSKMTTAMFKIEFILEENCLTVRLITEKGHSEALMENELGIVMIRALMDTLRVYDEKDESVIVMQKRKQ